MQSRPDSRVLSRILVLLAVAVAVGLAAVGFLRGTYAAGGSDSSCYALMADAFASGHLQLVSRLEPQVPWPDAAKTFVPGGFTLSPINPAAAAPVCAPGFSLLLAPFVKFGGSNALFAVTPIAGALLVWFSFVAARRLGGEAAGAMASILAATSPIVLFQVVQPMNDVTNAMLWMGTFAALITRRWLVAGLCCGAALLVRPNLLPLGIVAGGYVLVEREMTRRFSELPSNRAVPSPLGPPAVAFVLGVLPFLGAALWLNHALYGGALRSGYGPLNHLFSSGNVAANADRYGRWLVETHTPLVLAGVAAPFLVARDHRKEAWLALALAAATAGIYLLYTPFDDWSYLRFLLPALAMLVVLFSAATARLADRAAPPATYAIVALISLGLGLRGLDQARDRLAFQMRALEQRYRSAGIAVRDRLPADAAVFAAWDSGAMRFHARKEAIVWGALDPAWLDRALAWLNAHGHHPYLLLESWEEPGFRSRFAAASPLGNLDWPAKYEVDRVVRIYDPADRDRFLRGERIVTEYLWPLMKKTEKKQ